MFNPRFFKDGSGLPLTQAFKLLSNRNVGTNFFYNPNGGFGFGPNPVSQVGTFALRYDFVSSPSFGGNE